MVKSSQSTKDCWGWTSGAQERKRGTGQGLVTTGNARAGFGNHGHVDLYTRPLLREGPCPVP